MSSSPELRLLFPFTQRDTMQVRARIEGDLSRIARSAFAADPHLLALVLTGGFSRGEGTVRNDAPVNDYDLVAVRARPGGERLHREVAAQLSQDVGIEVDLMPIWRRRLRHVAPKLFWLDVRLGGRVIAGDPRWIDAIPLHGPEAIPRAEVARLLGNRAAGMLLSIPGEGEPEDARQRDLQATKAVLAAMDAALLSRGLYAARMRERLLLSQGHPHHALFTMAVGWKLGPGFPLPPDWWESARDALLHAVEETGARACRDGLVEHGLHLLRARRLAYSPSQAVRRAAWDILAGSSYPRGPADVRGAASAMRWMRARGGSWSALKRGFFDMRAKTLQ